MAAKKAGPALERRRQSAAARRAKEMAKLGFERDLVAVVMSFGEGEPRRVYEAIKAECAALGLHAKRADDLAGAGVVVQEITTLIEEAEFIVCDLTLGRPNVYYELGYAHGVGNDGSDIVLVAKKGARLHFDVAGLRVRRYTSTRELRRVLRDDLKRLIGARD